MEDFFNKPTYTSEDIDQLIKDKVEESIKLEFKEARALSRDQKKKNEISKDVSAFANSDGGIIIYGIEEEAHKPIALSFVDGKEFSNEWLEQVIQSTIFRKIEGIKVIPIRYEDDISKSIYVIKVPNDSSVPHMAFDKKYYRRHNFNSIAMEEYEVRNLYFKKEKPRLRLTKPDITATSKAVQNNLFSWVGVRIYLHIDNVGKVIETLFKLEVALPRLFVLHGKQTSTHALDKYFKRAEDEYWLYSFPNESPLFQDERATIPIEHLKITYHSFNAIKEQPLLIKLYYSGGVEVMKIKLVPHLKIKGKRVKIDDFKT